MAGSINYSDNEQLTYDAGGNVVERRLRDGRTIAYGYDDLGRLVSKDLPTGETDVVYAHDLLGRLTAATQGAVEVSFVHDALGRATRTTAYVAPGVERTTAYRYDLAGRRTRVTWADGFFAQYDHLVTGEVMTVREHGASSGAGVLATYAYDDVGRLASITRGNGTSTSYGYDAVSRLDALTQALTGTADDLALTFAYNPAGQIATATRDNESYAFDDPVAGTVTSVANGLNQLTQVDGQALSYDARGNLTSDGTTTYTYSSENLLTDVAQGATALAGMRYDPLLRLNRVTGSGMTRRFGWDGADMIAEYNYDGDLVRRYVHGPGIDNPLVWYEGSGTADRRWLHADERGSIVAASDGTGAAIVKNTYDEYGIRGASNGGRFQYTGQTWIGEAGLYYYKARFYSPTLGGRVAIP